MDPIRFAINKPVTVSVGVLLIVLFGLISLGQIPIQLTPNIEKTVVSITTRWEGASPQEIEREVVQEQEEKLKGIDGLTKMFSTSQLGEGVITLEFEQGMSKEAALREASDSLREVPDYPENVDEPIVEPTNPQDRDYIAWVILSTTDENYDVRKLFDFFDERVKPELERVQGVSEVNVIGGFEQEVHVLVDPTRMAQLSVSPSQLAAALRTQNVNASAGQLAEGKLDIRVRSIGRYDRVEDIENTLLSAPGDPVVRVKDVATVELGYKEPDRFVRNKGRTVMALNAQRDVGSNVMEVMARFKDRLQYVRDNLLPAEAKEIGLDGEIVMEQVYDQTIYIDQAIALVQQNLWVGGTLAIIVLLSFLRSVRSTVIIGIAIPVSVIGTFTAMTLMGRNLNVISLAGLAFAVGMVVDNAIVVLENIDRHRKLGQPAHIAAYKGAREVWGAVLASTLTTVAVFLPVLTVQEEAGQLFRDISLAIVASVTLSLIISITVIPSAASKLLKSKNDEHHEDEHARAAAAHEQAQKVSPITAAMRKLLRGVSTVIYWLTGSWIARLTIVAGLTAVSLIGAYLLMPPSSYLPPGNRNLVFALMFSPPGYNLQQQASIGYRIEETVRPFWEARGDPEKEAALPEARGMNLVTGEPYTVKPPAMENFFFVAVPGTMFMGAISDDPQRVQPHAVLLNNIIQNLPAINGFAFQRPLFQTASRGSGDALELEIAGADLDKVNEIAGRLMQKYGQQFGFGAVRPSPTNFDLPGPEIRVLRDPVKDTVAGDLGLTQTDINTAVQMLGDGAIVGDYLLDGDTIDLKVLNPSARDNGDAAYLADAPIATPAGRVVPLSTVRDVQRTVSPQQIDRVEEQRAVTLSINLPSNFPLEQATQQIESDIQQLRDENVIPSSVSTNLAGSAAKLKEVKHALLGEWTGFNVESFYALITSRMFLALVVVFMLMAALFESWVYPLVIMFSVPLATVGGFLGLRLVHTFVPSQQLDVLTMLGFVILIGIVVNNAILIVHQALNLMRGEAEVHIDGKIVTQLEPREAIAEAVRTRVRPIFMSMMTSVGGMLPLVLFPGSGSELYRGLGSVVVGGLLISTVFTLMLVPMLLSIVFDLRAAAVATVATVTGSSESTASLPD